MKRFREWLARLPPLGPYFAVAVVFLIVGAIIGNRTAKVPDRVTEESKTSLVATVAKTEDVTAAAKLDETTSKVKTKKQTVHKQELRPDGTVKTNTTTTTEEHTGTVTDTNLTASATGAATETGAFNLEEATREVTDYRRNWRVSALVGAQLVNPLANAGNPFGTIAYGIHAEHRLFGTPVWVGVWGMGVGNAQLWYAGGSLGVEF